MPVEAVTTADNLLCELKIMGVPYFAKIEDADTKQNPIVVVSQHATSWSWSPHGSVAVVSS
jgi:hypothetical protein